MIRHASEHPAMAVRRGIFRWWSELNQHAGWIGPEVGVVEYWYGRPRRAMTCTVLLVLIPFLPSLLPSLSRSLVALTVFLTVDLSDCARRQKKSLTGNMPCEPESAKVQDEATPQEYP